MDRTMPSEEQVRGWFETLSNWGRWGPDDERGTLNLITPEKRAQAAALARAGIVVSCAWPLGYEPSPAGPIPQRHFILKSGEGEPAERIGRTNALDAFLIAPHGFTITHLDAPSHTFWRSDPGRPWTMYNGKPKEAVTTVDGARAGSIELAGAGIVSRGVLLDVARLRGVEWLEPDDPVFPDDLEGAEQSQNVRVAAGDILFVRTGHPLRVAGRVAGWSDRACGLQAACLPWLRERDVAVLACDTANDVMPTQYPGLGINGAIHGIGMGALGLWLLDNPTLEELAETCAGLNRWEFQAVLAPLKLERATGSPVNPLAIF